MSDSSYKIGLSRSWYSSALEYDISAPVICSFVACESLIRALQKHSEVRIPFGVALCVCFTIKCEILAKCRKNNKYFEECNF